MFQANEGLGDALYGGQGRGGKRSALGSFHILTTHIFNPETILREQLGGPFCPHSSSCLYHLSQLLEVRAQ